MCINELDNLDSEYETLSVLGREALIDIISNGASPFSRRYAAGNLLALKGDPRIRVYDPEMIVIPGAEVTLGLDESAVAGVTDAFRQYGVLEEWIAKECPAHTVTLESFALGKYCVTNREYYFFLDDTGYEELPTSWPFGEYPRQRSNYPVYSVTHTAASAYAAWLSRKTGRVFHLPSEAQWEYAAAGNEGREYPWGEWFEMDRCNSVESGIIDATPVGLFPLGVGPFGHLDMAGNVEEYTKDSYQPYGKYPEIKDDLWLTQGENYPVARGGSFTRFRDLCRTRRRHGRYDTELYVMGFRLAEKIIP
ncbi:formylglycine-generating enzyme family protein [Serratia sp. L9]|uniref:formylglycine-generating enzyme family protein n=1 Tax=Serratia sp. L9 TaxID=3423946 RepID=UPI003D669535